MDIEIAKFLVNLISQLSFSPINEESKKNFLLAYEAREYCLKVIEGEYAHSQGSSS